MKGKKYKTLLKVKALDEIRRVFIMLPAGFYVAKAYDWKDYLDDLVDKAEWMSAFNFIVQLYNGNNNSFASFPLNEKSRKEVTSRIIPDLARKYLTSMFKALQNPDVKKEVIHKTLSLMVIDFLVSTEAFDCLFMDARLWFKTENLLDLFLGDLEAFTLRNKIKKIPHDALKEFVEYYVRNKKTNVI